MLHIVFQEADISVLQKAFDLDKSMAGEIIQIKDDFAVGPIQSIYEAEGYQSRREWWKNVLGFSPYTDQLNIVDDKLTVHNLLKQLDEDISLDVWVWMGQNQHDVCGYYWLMSQLKDYQGRIFVLYLNNLPFINEKGGIFYPTALHEIRPGEFLKAKKLARMITASEFEVDPDEWKKLCNENAMVRLLEGGKKIVNRDIDYYDGDLLNVINAEPQKLGRILSAAFSKMKVKTGDAFLVWRLRQLIAEGKLEVQGDWSKGWKDIFIRLAGAPVQTGPVNETI